METRGESPDRPEQGRVEEAMDIPSQSPLQSEAGAAASGKPRSLSLQRRLFLRWSAVSAFLLALMLLAGWLTLRRAVLREAEVSGSYLAASVVSELAGPLRVDHLEEVQEVLSTLFSFEDVLFATLVSGQGAVYARMGDPRGPEPPLQMVEKLRVQRGRDVLLISAPVRDPSLQVIGTLHLGCSLARVRRALSRDLLALLLIGLVFAAGAAAVAHLQAQRIAAPLRSLAQATRRLGQGDASTPLPAQASGEVGMLVEAFNDMARRLEDSKRQVDRQNRELEQAVRERTEELRRKNQALAVQNERVLAMSRLKSEFLANMSHELRTPLNAILALSELLRDEITGPLANEEQRKQASMIHASGEGLLRLINDVLDLSRVEAGKLEIRRAAHDPAELLKSAVSEVRQLALNKGLEIRLQIERSSPVWVDADRVRQIVLNLLGNAIKFTERGHIQVTAGQDADEERFQVTVEDTGVGIAPQDHERVFQEFQQVDGSATRRHGGTGLGLAISRRLVRLMGGELSVRSDLGQGSLFTFWLPAGREDAAQTQAAAEGSAEPADSRVPAFLEPWGALEEDPPETVGAGSGQVLLLGAGGDQEEQLGHALSRAGLEVKLLSSVVEAVGRMSEIGPDCIVLDPRMPDGWGLRFFDLVETCPAGPHVPILVYPAHGLSREDWAAYAGRADRILPREHGLGLLVEEVRRLVEEGRSRQGPSGGDEGPRAAA